MGKSFDFFSLVVAYNCILWELSWSSREISIYGAQVSSMARISFMAGNISDCSCVTALFCGWLNSVLSAHQTIVGKCYTSFNKNEEGGAADAKLHHQ